MLPSPVQTQLTWPVLVFAVPVRITPMAVVIFALIVDFVNAVITPVLEFGLVYVIARTY